MSSVKSLFHYSQCWLNSQTLYCSLFPLLELIRLPTRVKWRNRNVSTARNHKTNTVCNNLLASGGTWECVMQLSCIFYLDLKSNATHRKSRIDWHVAKFCTYTCVWPFVLVSRNWQQVKSLTLSRSIILIGSLKNPSFGSELIAV